jgi:N-methylhydantoinase B
MKDLFTLEIIIESLTAIAEEMMITFMRSARSPVITEVRDCSVGITNDEGQLVAQAPGLPVWLGILDLAVMEAISRWGNDVEPGDIIMSNLPYGSGTHLNDVALIMPIFRGGELISFVVNKAHMVDVGGSIPGSFNPSAIEVYQEGIQLPFVKLYSRGKMSREIIDLLKLNVRFAKNVLADIEAQAASLRIASQRILGLVEKYGIGAYREALDKALEDGRRLSLRLLEQLPKGVFTAEGYIDVADEPAYARAKVTITSEEFSVDFSGSSRQVRSSINCPLPSTIAAVRTIYVAVTDPHASPNSGFFTPVKVTAPEGTIFNPTHPAPVSNYFEAQSYAMDLVWRALAPHVPSRLTAGNFMSIMAVSISSIEGGDGFIIVEPQSGGWGAGYDMDGESALIAPREGEVYTSSAEVYEALFPILVDRYELNTQDGAGHGKYRGGFGTIKDYVLLTDATVTFTIGRCRDTPWGVQEGLNGTPNYVIIQRGDESMRLCKASGLRLKRGDKVSIRSGGGGGWGNPLERETSLILRDLLEGYITHEIAAKIYGLKQSDTGIQMK